MARLIVLSDDWGRHPSSCQHLVRRLRERHPTLWVNTIGTRQPRPSRGDAVRIAQRMRAWLTAGWFAPSASTPLPNLRVITPRMWPRFHRRWQQRLNGALLGRAVGDALADSAATDGERRIVLATVPIAATLLDRISADAWIYYRVDDFAAWPGLDSQAMGAMEATLLARADHIVAASPGLQTAAAAIGRPATLLTHGVDLAHWGGLGDDAGRHARLTPPAWARGLRRPIAMLWGLIDRRLDVDWLRALTEPGLGPCGSLVLVGPTQAHHPAIATLDGVCLPGPVPYDDLPGVATVADVLVMPYADTPATRAMQPLKLKEYLATGKPVVVRNLPATREWADAADVVDSAEMFARTAAQRVRTGLPEAQRLARQRLRAESWDAKARALEAIVLGLAHGKIPSADCADCVDYADAED